jgi:multidrug transporter EmrE-like cation transporter
MKLNVFLCLILLIVVEMITVSMIKKWSVDKNSMYLVLGVLGYMMVGLIFSYILTLEKEIMIVNTLWQIANIILVSAIGYFVFKEKLTPIQAVGVTLAILSVILVSL